MKSVRIAALLLVLGLSALPGVVRANDDPDARESIQLRYNLFNTAYMNKDFKTIAGIFSPKCSMKLVGEGRSMAIAKVMKGMESVSKSLTVSHAKTRIVSFRKSADGHCQVDAVWTANSDYSPVNHSKEDPARHSKSKQMYRDTWEPTSTGWQITGRIIRDADDDEKPKLKK